MVDANDGVNGWVSGLGAAAASPLTFGVLIAHFFLKASCCRFALSILSILSTAVIKASSSLDDELSMADDDQVTETKIYVAF